MIDARGDGILVSPTLERKLVSPFTTLKNIKSIIDIFSENPKKYMPSLVLAEEVLREPGALSAAEREIIAAYTSYLNGCSFCYDSHAEFARSLGVSDAELTSIIREEYSLHRLEQVFKYVKKLTLKPNSIQISDFNDVVSSGVSEDELKDAIAVCAAFNYYNRIVEGHFLETNPEGFKQDAEMINKFGYDRRRFNA